VLGGALGGALIKDKLFGYVGYQHLHDGDGEIGISRLSVPFGLTDSNRTAAGLANLANQNFIIPDGGTPILPTQIDPVAMAMFQFKLPNGQYMIPSMMATFLRRRYRIMLTCRARRSFPRTSWCQTWTGTAPPPIFFP
jgi:hypothetical protein